MFNLLRCSTWKSGGLAPIFRNCSPRLLSATAKSKTFQKSSFPKIVADDKTTLMFEINDAPGSLQSALQYFWKNNINLSRLESRPSRQNENYEFYVSFSGKKDDPKVEQLLKDLSKNTVRTALIPGEKVPWFPRHISELDLFANKTLDAGADLQSDHPGFNDKEYRERRAVLAQVALDYKIGEQIPTIDYTEDEIMTWTTVHDKLWPLLEKHATEKYNTIMPALEANCGYGRTSIPQLQDISDYLQQQTGFRLRPVSGLLSARNFLYGLAFRVFFSTQYIRHHTKPLYTPEPDICHELIGHVPLFADKEFANFSQEIGLASIGATDEQITALARCYWYSVEFGLCMENGERKAYGAGLLSSFGELGYAMSNEPEIREWDPFHAAKHDYPITTYQPVYYCASSLEDAKIKMSNFANSFSRPFHVRYNPYTKRIEVDKHLVLQDPSVNN